MREILFRGKTTTGKEWVEGSLIVKDGHYYIYHPNEYFMFDMCQGARNQCYIVILEVIPETVGQYTGLTDKNGTKIFEGDIVEFCDIKGVINFGTGCYCVKTNKPDWGGRNNPAIDIVLNEYENELKVIGNIHDNPELLKECEGK